MLMKKIQYQVRVPQNPRPQPQPWHTPTEVDQLTCDRILNFIAIIINVALMIALREKLNEEEQYTYANINLVLHWTNLISSVAFQIHPDCSKFKYFRTFSICMTAIMLIFTLIFSIALARVSSELAVIFLVLIIPSELFASYTLFRCLRTKSKRDKWVKGDIRFVLAN